MRAPMLAAALLGLAAALAAPAAADPPDAADVRVLLLEAPGPLRIVGPRSETWLERAALGVRARGGGEAARWRSRGEGPFRVAGYSVRGALEVRPSGPALAVVNELPLESYVAASLGREAYPRWEPAALRAQAIAIRTYALHQRAARRAAGAFFDLEAGTRNQVYGGLEAESEPVRAAVRATRGEVLTFAGEPILAAYHSASGGHSAGAEEVWGRELPYLRGAPVEDEEVSPDTYWRVTIERTTLRRALAARGEDPGEIRSIEVAARWPSGRVRTVRVRGGRRELRLGGRELRAALGEATLRSTLFEIRGGAAGDGERIVLVGSGSGHGVGMSQWGAQALAARGFDHAAILAHFYPGTRLETASTAVSAGERGR